MKLTYKLVKVEIPDKRLGGIKVIGLEFVNSCHTIFHNSKHLLIQLKPIQRTFLDFLIERMSQENWVMISKHLKSEFIVFLFDLTSGKSSISERSLEKYLSDFVSLHLLIKVKNTPAGYYVNPKYFSHAGSEGRTQVIMMLFKKASLGEIDFEPLLDKPLSEYNL